MLKTRSISASGTEPRRWSQGKTLGTGHDPRRSWMAQPSGRTRGIIDEAAAGDMGNPMDDALDPIVPVHGLEGPHVDPGRFEQFLGRRAAQLLDERLRHRPARSNTIFRARL